MENNKKIWLHILGYLHPDEALILNITHVKYKRKYCTT